MVRMPDASSIRQTPNLPSPAVPRARRNIIGEAVGRIGETLERNADANLELSLRMDKRERDKTDALELARARSDFAIRRINEDQLYSLDKDQKPETWGKRYATNIEKHRNSSASLISNPEIREKFIIESAEDVVRGNAAISDRVSGIQRDRTRAAGVKAIDDNLAIISRPGVSDEDRDRIMAATRRDIDNMVATGVLSATEAINARQNFVKGYSVARIQQDITSDPESAYRHLSGGPGEIYYAKLRGKESSGDDTAKADKSSALGRYQFTKGTWDGLRKAHPELGLTEDGRTNADQQERAIRAFTQDNIKALSAAGIPISEANLYMAHFMGAQGAIDMIRADPGANAAQLFPQAASANPTIFFTKDGTARTVEEVYALQTKKFSTQEGPAPDYYQFVEPQDRVRLASAAEGEWASRAKAQKETEAFERYALKKDLEDDVAQMEETGKGQDISVDQVRTTLGDVEAAKWVEDRETAAATYKATSELEGMPSERMDAYLDELEPEAGSQNFARNQTIYEKAQRKADKIRALRISDPAKSVEDSPLVRKAMEGINPEDPSTIQELVRARLAAQNDVGIPAAMQQPVTKAEAKQIISPIERVIDMQDATIVSLTAKKIEPGDRRAAVKQVRQQAEEQIKAVVEGIEQTYGPDLAPKVLAFAIAESVRDKDIGDLASGVLRKIAKGQKVGIIESQALDDVKDVATAEKAMEEGLPQPARKPAPAAPQPQRAAIPAPNTPQETDTPEQKPKQAFGPFPAPSSDAVSLLLRQPELAPRFEAIYGPGSAAEWLPRE